LIVFGSILIKIPIFIIHLWLPKAHVEAPVFGSIILAGVLLKMGRFGLIRFIKIFIKITSLYRRIFIRIGIIGGILIRLVCLVQIDIKSLVAYSSVVHINVILCSLFTLRKIGLVGAVIIIIAHGLCSSGIFYLVGLRYKGSGSRLLLLNKGMLRKVPRISF